MLEDKIAELRKAIDNLAEENVDVNADWVTHLEIASLHLGWALKDLKR